MLDVTCAIVIKDGKILITQNGKDSDHPLEWEFPGGKIEPGENGEECIIREMKEELNVKIEVIKEMEAVVFSYSNKTIQLIPFICRLMQGEIHLREHINYKWVKFEELTEINFAGADKHLLKAGANFSRLKEYTRK